MNGNAGKRVDVHAFARMKNGNTMIVESGVGRVIEVDTGRCASIRPQTRRHPKHPLGTPHPTGTLLVCSERPGVVTGTIAPARWFGITSSTRACTAPFA